MKKLQFLALFLLFSSLLFMACVPNYTSTTLQQREEPAVVPLAVPALQETWELILKAAKREGRLDLLTSGASPLRTAMVEGFKSAYGISVEAASGRSTEQTARIFAERRAGLYLHDVYIGGDVTPLTVLKPMGTLEPLTPALILPDVTDPELIRQTWYRGKLPWLDNDRTVLATALNVSYPLAINTNLIKDGEIKSYRDLLNPKWQGKIVLNDPTLAGSGQNFLVLVEDRLGWHYFEDLVKTRPIVINDQQLQLAWLAQGKVAIVIAPKPEILAEFVSSGAPARGLMPQESTWVSVGTSTIEMFNKSPHPNAAKVFINWLLSKEGSTAVSKAASYHMTRLDVPVDHLTVEQRRDPRENYVDSATEDVVLRKPLLSKKAEQLLATLMGR